MSVQILAVTDTVDQRIYSSSLKERMNNVQLIGSAGDVPPRYLEFIVDALNRPLYYVMGNHAEEVLCEDGHLKQKPQGARDIGGKVVRDPETGLILAGLPGSPRYNRDEAEQHSELEMYWLIAKMVPRLLWNRLMYGRAVDVLVSHAPARDLNDRPDEAHRGFKAIRSFLKWFKPAYHLHGHVHLYDRSQSAVVTFGKTTIVNVYPYHVLDLDVPACLPETDPAPASFSLNAARAVQAPAPVGVVANPGPSARDRETVRGAGD
jgi:hypothetical protein